MTKKQRKINREIKKKYQTEGLIPPDKKRLNRKKFIEEARKEWEGKDNDCLIWGIYLHQALGNILSHTDNNFRPSLEAVGAAKVVKMAIRLKEFDDMIRSEGKNSYKIQELYDYIKDILNA